MNTKMIEVLASIKVEDTFKTRLVTVLKNGNIHTMDVLLGREGSELLKIPGFGKNALSEVADAFEQIGICRPPYYDELPWRAVRHELEKQGYTEGAIVLFREMLPKSGLAGVRQRKDKLN